MAKHTANDCPLQSQPTDDCLGDDLGDESQDYRWRFRDASGYCDDVLTHPNLVALIRLIDEQLFKCPASEQPVAQWVERNGERIASILITSCDGWCFHWASGGGLAVQP
jgi:hypothetical protein